MYRFISAFIILLLIFSCSPKKLTPEEIAKAKTEIESIANAYNKGIIDKDTKATMDLFSQSPYLQIIGTDSAEVFKSLEKFKSHLEVDWELLTVSKVYDIRNVAIQISEDGTLASILYESPWDLTIANQMMHAILRFSWTLIKEDNQWKIVQGMGQFASVGQS